MRTQKLRIYRRVNDRIPRYDMWKGKSDRILKEINRRDTEMKDNENEKKSIRPRQNERIA